MKSLLVVRFPNGTWSYGGKADDPDYELCEKFEITTDKSRLDPGHAIKIAQGRRKRLKAKEALSGN